MRTRVPQTALHAESLLSINDWFGNSPPLPATAKSAVTYSATLYLRLLAVCSSPKHCQFGFGSNLNWVVRMNSDIRGPQEILISSDYGDVVQRPSCQSRVVWAPDIG